MRYENMGGVVIIHPASEKVRSIGVLDWSPLDMLLRTNESGPEVAEISFSWFRNCSIVLSVNPFLKVLPENVTGKVKIFRSAAFPGCTRSPR